MQLLTIERLGQRGEGIAQGADGLVFVPYALPGDTIKAEVTNERGQLVEIVTSGPDRIAPFCPHYTICGGCAVQALAAPAYNAWKRELVVAALAAGGVKADVAPLVDAHGAGRRRATFHAGFSRPVSGGGATLHVGFMRARAHEIIEIDSCPVFTPQMAGAVAAARAVAEALKSKEKPLDIIVTATDEGLDVDVRGAGPLDFALSQRLIGAATACDLARVSNHGEIVIERRTPALTMGSARVTPPPGTFLQATQMGEETLAKLVSKNVGKAKIVADLFSGVGTFALRLAEKSEVLAVESEATWLGALERAAHNAQGLRRVSSETRDLFRRPLLAGELARFDAVVFDPPRAGAEAQARALASSTVATVIGVSCNVQTFARDARILIDGGYVCESVTPVDQFRHSAHVEMVGVFKRPAKTGKPKRRLLG